MGEHVFNHDRVWLVAHLENVFGFHKTESLVRRLQIVESCNSIKFETLLSTRFLDNQKITLSHIALGREDDRFKPVVAVLNAFALTDIHYLGENLGIAKLKEDGKKFVNKNKPLTAKIFNNTFE